MTRIGKIARLPIDIRTQLNHRLNDGVHARDLLEWVNELPETLKMLETHFEGSPISPQNLSEWRNGGFAEWQAKLELLADANDIDEEAHMLKKPLGEGHLIDRVADVLAARYAKLVNNLPDEPDEKFEAKVKLLVRLTRSVVQLQKSIHRAAQQNDEAQQVDKKRKEDADEARRNRVSLLLDAPDHCEIAAKGWGGSEFAYDYAADRFQLDHNLTEEELENLKDTLRGRWLEKHAKAAAAANAAPASGSSAKTSENPSQSN